MSSLPPLVEPAAELSRAEVARYSRHLIIPDVGMDGQKRLKNARVLVIGAGGLGSPTLLYLAAAGVGTLGILDFDTVDESNLQRQVIHSEGLVGVNKALSAAARVAGRCRSRTTSWRCATSAGSCGGVVQTVRWKAPGAMASITVSRCRSARVAGRVAASGLEGR